MAQYHLISTHILLLAIGIILLVLGLVHNEACPVETALPNWMLLSGSVLAVISVLVLVHQTCLVCNCFQRCQRRQPTKTTLGNVICGCTFFTFFMIGFLILFGLWIAGSYFVVRAIRAIRVPDAESHNSEKACSLSLVLPAGISILLVWILFLAGIVRFLLIIFQSRPTTNRLKKEPIYDEVHRDDNYL
ncbi:uncharacterized protein LOC131882581 isoform X1 [Tigriopus californicus]|uniref:uncharacterized protein LOC131882581 isoform X1 n=1 Tax=Tigriopus californicus TaxID=6832 RepID=UPI0027DA63CC|nr:uncharacterized protein LOC131882581 isoform X1 [Tigriopus californicus]